MRIFIAVSIGLLTFLPAMAQETTQVVPMTIEELFERRHTTQVEIASKLAEAQLAYDKAIAEADKELKEEVKRLAKAEFANGDLPGAAKIWEEILKVDAKDGDASEFFQAIGRRDILRKYAIKSPAQPPVRPILQVHELSHKDIAGKTVNYFWNPTGWRFQENGAVYNVNSRKVVANNATWSIENGRLRTWTGQGEPSMTFICIEFNGSKHLIGDSGHFIALQ